MDPRKLRKVRHTVRIAFVCPEWLKTKIEVDADSEDRTMSELIRERLAAPYRKSP